MKFPFLLFLLFFGCLTVNGQSLDTPEHLLERDITAILQEGIHAKAFPGAQVMVMHQGRKIIHLAQGFQTYDSIRPVETDAIYDLASVTKTSSALLYLMQQYDRGELDLDAPLSSLFPLFKGTDKAAIPLRAALAHQARLRPWVPYWQSTLKGNARYPWEAKWDGKRTNTDDRFKGRTIKQKQSKRYPIRLTDELWLHRKFRERVIYQSIKKSPLEAEAEYKYSGLLFYLLPDYVERQTGQDYEAYLREHFYDPLGATTLGYRPLERGFGLENIIPTENDTFFRKQLLHGVVHDEGAALMNGISANAGLFSNAEDLAKLWQMLLNGGELNGKRYFQESTVREFTRVQFPENDNRRGLGFDKPLLTYDKALSTVPAAASPNSFGHSGYTGTLVWADPDKELLFIFLSNRVYPSRDSRGIYELSIRPRIMELVYGYLGTSK